jgi:multiple sugar transport system substrate-binding protein
MQMKAAVLATALMLAASGARAADLVVWWEEGFYAQEDEAVREVIAAFEKETGKQVELTLHSNLDFPDRLAASVEAGQPPDFAFSLRFNGDISGLAFEDRLVDLTDTVDSYSSLFDPDALEFWVLLNEKTGQRKLYALPMGRTTNHVHVWKTLLAQAGFTLEDIPRKWDAFWAFWCDEVQPAVRRAMGRDDIWGLGLPMSVEASDTNGQFRQFLHARAADWVTRDGRLVIDDPDVRRKLIEAMDSYTAIYRKGCTPPDAITWANIDNNKRFLARSIVMTANDSLSIPNALKRERPQDYYENTATIEWPLGQGGEPFPIDGQFYAAVVFKDGGNVAVAKEFVRFLVAEGWLAHYRLRRRAHAAADAEAARPAVLARPERPAPYGRGDAGRVAPDAIRLRHGLRRLAL